MGGGEETVGCGVAILEIRCALRCPGGRWNLEAGHTGKILEDPDMGSRSSVYLGGVGRKRRARKAVGSLGMRSSRRIRLRESVVVVLLF